MRLLSELKYCCEYDSGVEIGKNVQEERKFNIIGDCIVDVLYEKVDKDIIVSFDEYDYNTNKIYLWQKILVNWLIGDKGYKKVIFKTNYINLNYEQEKSFETVIQYPIEQIVAGAYCSKCIKNKECKELKNVLFGNFDTSDIKNNSQLYNTYLMFGQRKSVLEAIEKELKGKLDTELDKGNGSLFLEEINATLVRNQKTKDSLKYSDIKHIPEMLNDDILSVMTTETKKLLKSNKILASKITFKKVPWQTSWELK